MNCVLTLTNQNIYNNNTPYKRIIRIDYLSFLVHLALSLIDVEFLQVIQFRYISRLNTLNIKHLLQTTMSCSTSHVDKVLFHKKMRDPFWKHNLD